MTKPEYRTPRALQALFDERQAAVAALAAKPSISPADLLTVDRIGRSTVANELWIICDESARQALLDDPHHVVRSCASIASCNSALRSFANAVKPRLPALQAGN